MGEATEAVRGTGNEWIGDHATTAMILVQGGGARGLAQAGGRRKTDFMGWPQHGQVGVLAAGEGTGERSAAAAPTCSGMPV